MSILTRGERFKDARTSINQHGKQTMKAVEQNTGVSASLIKDLEDDNSTRSVGYDKVAVLAKHYGVSANWLLGLTGDPAIMPSATDELGLKPSVVQMLTKEWAEEKQEAQNWIEETGSVPDKWFGAHSAMNALLENPLMEIIFAKIAISARRIESYRNTVIPQELSHLENLRTNRGEAVFNYTMAKNMEYGLCELHPELTSFIHITYGTDSLRMDIDEICASFRYCVEEITGYREFVNSRCL